MKDNYLKKISKSIGSYFHSTVNHCASGLCQLSKNQKNKEKEDKNGISRT